MRAWLLTSSPTSFLTLFLEGVLVWSLWLAARSRGDTNPSCLSQLDGFMKSVAHDAVPARELIHFAAIGFDPAYVAQLRLRSYGNHGDFARVRAGRIARDLKRNVL